MCPGWFNFGFPKFVTSRLNHILSWPPRSHFGATAPSSRLSKRCCGSCRRWGVSTGVAGEARRQIQKNTYTMMRLKQKETKESIHTTMRPNEKETKNPKRVNLAFCTTDKTNSPPTVGLRKPKHANSEPLTKHFAKCFSRKQFRKGFVRGFLRE